MEDWGESSPIPGGGAVIVVHADSDNYTVEEGDNVLIKGDGSQTTGQIIINSTATVTIQWRSTAIGGKLNERVGSITIKSATINASTTDNFNNGVGAAIGSGSSTYSGTKK